MNHGFPPDVAEGIVAHMNEDHADAVLAIVRAHGGARDAAVARLLAIAPDRLEIEAGSAGATHRVTVPVDPPIDPLDTVRARLVEMTTSARAALDSPTIP